MILASKANDATPTSQYWNKNESMVWWEDAEF